MVCHGCGCSWKLQVLRLILRPLHLLFQKNVVKRLLNSEVVTISVHPRKIISIRCMFQGLFLRLSTSGRNRIQSFCLLENRKRGNSFEHGLIHHRKACGDFRSIGDMVALILKNLRLDLGDFSFTVIGVLTDHLNFLSSTTSCN